MKKIESVLEILKSHFIGKSYEVYQYKNSYNYVHQPDDITNQKLIGIKKVVDVVEEESYEEGVSGFMLIFENDLILVLRNSKFLDNIKV